MNIQEAKQRRSSTPCRRIFARMTPRIICFRRYTSVPILLMGPPGYRKDGHHGTGRPALRRKDWWPNTITHHTPPRAPLAAPAAGKNLRRSGHVCHGIYHERDHRFRLRDHRAYRLSGSILFLDEINCVSETLAPTMLQFLQNKTFGTHRVPEGWVIVLRKSAGYNKSVREFDVVTLDRVRQINIKQIWISGWIMPGEATPRRGHFLSVVKPEQFYMVKRTEDNLSFVTARGWEDLSPDTERL